MTEPPSGSGEPASGLTLAEPGPSERPEKRSFIRELPVLILIALVLAIVLKTFVVQAFSIPSGSMEPTLRPGDRILVQKLVYGPDRGDVIVFSDPKGRPGPDRGIVGGFVHWLSGALGIEQPEHEDFIKRVIGLPGEVVEIRRGTVYVDGTAIREPYLEGPVDTRRYGPMRVPPGDLFVLGDNRLNSNDSRFGLGFVPIDKVVGRAFVIVWPPSRMGWVH